MNSTILFDRLATCYDARWTNTPIGRAQRDLVWRELDELFHPGQHVLDIGCGTGEDAAHLTARGVSVFATDASSGMIAVAQARGGFEAEVCAAEEIASLGAMFDGAISDFGALNCVEDLPAVARSLAAIVRPGASVAICLLGRFCAWESLYYALDFQFRKAVRRWRGRAGTGTPCSPVVYYPTLAQFRSAFAPGFELQRWTGIGLFVPPSYVHLSSSIRFLAACDRLLARLPLLRAMADHRLFLLVRKSC
jgi:ubiquinone/menaquinone biosynthesis C-methylase UbiE